MPDRITNCSGWRRSVPPIHKEDSTFHRANELIVLSLGWIQRTVDDVDV